MSKILSGEAPPISVKAKMLTTPEAKSKINQRSKGSLLLENILKQILETVLIRYVILRMIP